MSDDSDGRGATRRHAEKMARNKAARDKIMATKTGEKGLLIVHTGTGKGKHRRLRHGLPLPRPRLAVGVVQFIKGAVGHRRAPPARAFRRSRHAQGDGRGLHLGDAGPRARHRRGAGRLGEAKELIRDELQLVLLDEFNIVLRYDYLPLDEVVDFLRDDKPRTCTSLSPAATPSRS